MVKIENFILSITIIKNFKLRKKQTQLLILSWESAVENMKILFSVRLTPDVKPADFKGLTVFLEKKNLPTQFKPYCSG